MPDAKTSALPTLSPPLGADYIPILDSSVLKRMTVYDLMQFLSKKGTDVASAATTTFGDGELFHVTGTVTITAIAFTNSWVGRRARVVFDGTLTLTHNATSLILPGGQNIVTGVGDSATFVVDNGTNVKCMQYERAAQNQVSNPSNSSTASQSPAAAATTYLTSSNIAIPSSGLRAGSNFYWRMAISKTAAGVATKSILVKLGTAGTTADTTILTFALPAGTAVVDTGIIEIFVTCRGPLGASCIFQGHIFMTHALANVSASELTGLINTRNQGPLPATSAAFNSAQAGLIMGLAFTAGASEAWTFTQMISQSDNL